MEFAELWRYYEQAEGLGGLDPKADGRPDEWKNQLNISQLTKAKPSNRIDVQKALATLDTNIFELYQPELVDNKISIVFLIYSIN